MNRTMSTPRSTNSMEMAFHPTNRAVRAARPRPVFDSAMLRAYTAENQAEELALADSDLEHRAQLLADEDAR